MLYTELYRVNVPQEKLTVPKYLPNNLKKIKVLYKLTDKELANRLNIEPSYISSVSNCKATFSGGITIKLLEELDINFSSFSNINETITTNCYEYEDALIVISSEEKLSKTNMTQLNKISYDCVKIYDNDNKDTQVSIVLFSELEALSDRYEINTNTNIYAELGEEKISKYNDLLKEVPIIDAKSNYIYAIGADIRKTKEKVITINTMSSFDNEKCAILSKIPFKKINVVSLPEDKYTLSGKNMKLNNKYSILTDKGMKSVNTLKPNQYKIKSNKTLFFNAFTDDDVWNKFKSYRLLTGYSSEYMATLLGIRKESYRLLEIGHNKLTTHQMWIIENKLGILLEYMIDFNKYTAKFNS